MLVGIAAPHWKCRRGGYFQNGPSREKQGIWELKITKKHTCFLNDGLFDLPRSEKQNKELYIFEKGVFWSGLHRDSRVAKSEKWEGGGCSGGLSRGTYPYMGVHPLPPPGLGFCNFRLENEFRTNSNPILTKCWVKFVKIGNAIRVFTIF